jgi:two-component system cell cycle response regulator
MNVLLIETQEFYQKLFMSRFAQSGYTVFSTSNSSEALKIFDTQVIDVIVTSKILDDIQIYEFLPPLKQRENYRVCPIYMLSSFVTKDEKQQLLRSEITEIFGLTQIEALESVLFSCSESLKPLSNGTIQVLYVEDSLFIAEMNIKFLASFGLNIKHFVDAESALEDFKNHKSDIILTDVFLKGQLSGLDLIRNVRLFEKADKHKTPILVFSSNDDTAFRIELLRSGANDFVSKPVAREEMIARLRTLIENQTLIYEIQKQNEVLENMAMTDALTGLFNRRCIEELAKKKLYEAERHLFNVSLALIDIDFFKKVNDTYGHEKGDDVLKEVADIFKNCCRQEDFTGRMGGEEFVIFLGHCSPEHALMRAQFIRHKIETSKICGLDLTISIGVHGLTVEDQYLVFEEILAKADQALYHSKNNGRNTATLWSMME